MFKFELGESVLIKSLELTGLITGRMQSLNADTEYRVVYWADSKRNVEWLFDFEITKQQTNNREG